MPVYDFICECGNKVEVIIKLSAYDKKKKNVACDKCGNTMKRAYTTSPSLEFLGTGWHKTDY